MKVLWSTLAIKNLEDIYEFHATSNKQTAAKIYNQILDEVKRLERYSFIPIGIICESKIGLSQ